MHTTTRITMSFFSRIFISGIRYTAQEVDATGTTKTFLGIPRRGGCAALGSTLSRWGLSGICPGSPLDRTHGPSTPCCHASAPCRDRCTDELYFVYGHFLYPLQSAPSSGHEEVAASPPLLLAAHWAAAAVQVPPAAVVGPPLPPILLTLDPLLLYILTPLTPRPRGELCPPVGGDAGWHANRATHRIYVNADQGLPIKS